LPAKGPRKGLWALQSVWKATGFCKSAKQTIILPILRVAAQPMTLEITMIVPKLTTLAIAAFVMTATAAKADILLLATTANQQTIQATDTANSADDRLLIVNGNTGHVIYDDGNDDLFCVTRKVVVGYNEFGYPIRKRTMRCR
jgi:hypothetical protein